MEEDLNKFLFGGLLKIIFDYKLLCDYLFIISEELKGFCDIVIKKNFFIFMDLSDKCFLDFLYFYF